MSNFDLLWAALSGVAALWALLRWEARHGNAASCTRDLWDVALAAIIAGVAAGRIWAMVRAGVNPVTHPGDIVIVRGGVDTVAASAAALGTVAFLARRELWQVADGLAAAALAGLAGWHAGCLWQDTCAGTPSDLPWSIRLPGGTVSRHPVELYAAAALVVAAGVVAVWKRRTPPPGIPAGVALGVAALVRDVTEPLRPSLVGGSTWWYVTGVAVGLGVVLWRRRAASAAG